MGKPAEEIPPARRISSIFMILVFVMLILSVAALYQVIEAYRRGTVDITNIILSLSAIAVSTYMLLQLRAKPLKLGFEMQEVSTTIECPKCGYKNSREFKRGDFIFKTVEQCPKCNDNMIISSIYRKPEEKKREKSFF
ncbi:MAG: hypothetical protein ACE5NN_02180 [Candidatus Bathyarchaeia archaeon]